MPISHAEIKERIDAIHADAEKNDGSGHAVFGASTSERWVNCPGSISLSKKFPRRPAGSAAVEGSLAHLCLEIFMVHAEEEGALGLRKKLWKHFGPDMVSDALNAYTFLKARAPAGALIEAEQKVDASHFTKAGQFGTCDCAIIEEFGRLEIWDFKYGRNFVPAKDNLQLIYYALAVSKRFDHNFDSVTLGVIQPRCITDEGHTRSHTMTIDDLLKHEGLFLRAVKDAERAKPPFKSGDHCRYCDGKPACPEIQRTALVDAGLDFSEIVETVLTPPLPIEPAKLQRMLDAFPMVEEYIAAVRTYAEETLQRGGGVPGYRLEDKRATRKWSSTTVETEARKTFGDLAFKPKELLSPAQLEDALKEHYVPKFIKSWIDKRVSSVSSGKKLARIPTSEMTIIEGRKRK